MTTYNCWLVVMLAVGTVASLVTLGVAGGAVVDIEGASVERASVDTHAMAGFGAGAITGSTQSDSPTARLDISPNPANPGETVQLDATDSTSPDGQIVECDFDVDGDGSFDVFGEDDCVVTHQYNQTGDYQVTVRVRDSRQQTDTDTETLTVTELPDAQFTWAPTEPTTGESVEFDASDSTDPDGQIVEYRWDFDGDNAVDATETDPITTHTYNEPGTYSVTLEVVDDDGAVDTTTRDVTVTANPVARCSVSATQVEPNEQVTIDASDSNADLVRFDVDGDGTFDRTNDDDFQEAVTYSEPGNYTPVVRAEINQESDTTQCSTITVVANDPPTATFTWSPTEPAPGESVEFDASDSNDSDGQIVEYRWDFDGDNAAETVKQVPTATHTFDEPGTYPVTLEVVDDDGAVDTLTRDVTVTADPVARCSVSATQVEPNEQVTIDASDSNADLVRFDVDGDGTFDRTNDDDFQEAVTYSEPGNYTPVVRAQISQKIDTEQCSTISVETNEPPTAIFEVDPEPGTVGEPMTFNASDSFDEDGEIVEYQWDFDNDGQFDRNTTAPVVTHTFDEPGQRTVHLRVVDDDGATDIAAKQGIEVESPGHARDARCIVSRRVIETGETAVIEVDGPELQFVEVDTDGDGDYDETVEEGTSLGVSYGEPGTYEPRVRVTDTRQRTAVIDCGTIRVDDSEGDVLSAGNYPPVARLGHTPDTAEPGEQVVLDASDSFDEDGEIVVYRWDLDNDGDFDLESINPTVPHAFEESGTHTVRVVVEDDDRSQDETTDVVDISSGTCGFIAVPLPFTPTETLCGLILPILILIGGGLGGLMLCRLGPRIPPIGGGAASSGLTAYAAGTIGLPTAGETVAVTDLDFEPDLVLLTASHAVVSAGPGHVDDTSVGWSYGVVGRTGDGAITQHVVSVADDARHPEVTTAAARDGDAVYLPAFDGGRVDGLAARVERTTDDGFELSVPAVDTAANADGAVDRFTGRPVVLFRAFETENPDDIDVGYFRAPAEPGVQSVEVATTTANHVTLTACTALDELDTAWATEGTVSLSTGEVVGSETVQQVVTAGTVPPSMEGLSSTAATDDRAIHLLYQTGTTVDGRTTAGATSLGAELDLEYDTVHVDEGATPSGGPPLVSYVAMNAGDAVPAVGYFELPGPDENGDLSVATGFEPGLVEFTVCDIDERGERVGTTSPFPWGRSHGVAMEAAEGIDQYLLHGAVDPDWTVSGASAPADGLGARGVGAGLAANGGTGARITGRDDLEVTAFTETGFDIRTTHLSTDARDPGADSEKLVFYKAWPKPAP